MLYQERNSGSEHNKQSETTLLTETVDRLKILFLVPIKGGSGGVHSIVQETVGMLKKNVYVRIAIPVKYKENYLELYPEARNAFIFYKYSSRLLKIARSFNIVVATIYSTVPILHRIINVHPHIKPAYYIQDYEPYFFRKSDKRYKEARASYEIIPSIHAFAKTEWLCNIVKEKHQLEVHKVQPSLDRKIFRPPKTPRKNPPIVITAMIRPSTSRRSPYETLVLLQKVKELFKEKVTIAIFGCSDETIKLFSDVDSSLFQNYGVLKREEVAMLLQKSHIFIDLSSYQAFGRTGLEAMAVGCCTLLPNVGGTTEYAIHEQNSLLVNVKEIDKVIMYLERLINEGSFRDFLSSEAIKTAERYSVEQATTSILSYFQTIINPSSPTNVRYKNSGI